MDGVGGIQTVDKGRGIEMDCLAFVDVVEILSESMEKAQKQIIQNQKDANKAHLQI